MPDTIVEGRTFDSNVEPEAMPGITDKETRLKLGLPEAPEPKKDVTPKEDGTKKGPEFEVPEKYEGKSQEDLLKILSDRDKTVGEQGTRIKKIEDDLEFNKRIQGLNRPITPDAGRPEPKAEESKYKDDDFISYKDVKDLVADAVTKDRNEQGAISQNKLITLVGAAHEEGRKTMAGKKIAEGIEKEVENAVYLHFKDSVERGLDVSGFLREPKTWEDAARYIRFRRGEYEYLTEGKDKTKDTRDIEPVAPVRGEVPVGKGSHVPDYGQAEPIRFNPHNKYVMDKFGLTEEEATTGLQDIRDRRRRGEQV